MSAFNRFEKPTLDELSEILRHVPYDDRVQWFKTFAIVGRVYDRDPAAFAICQQWAAQYSKRSAADAAKERTEFFTSSQREGAGIGSLIRVAKLNGYKVQYRHDENVHVHGAANSALEALRVPTYATEPKEGASNALVMLYGDAQENAQAALKFWLWTDSTPLPIRNAFMRRYSKAFSQLPKNEGGYFELLAEYTASHSLYSFEAFINWSEEHYYDFDADQLIGLISGAKQLDNYEAADHAMDHAIKASWQVSLQNRASELASLLTNSQYTAEKAENLLKRFIELSTPFNPQQPAITGHDIAPIGRRSITEKLDPELIKLHFIQTGYDAIDSYIHGWRRGGVTIAAAHSGVGKTWLGVDASRKVMERGGRVLFISTEMSRESIAERLYCNVSRLDPNVLRGNDYAEQIINTTSQDVEQFFKDNELINIVEAHSLDEVVNAIDSRVAFAQTDLIVIDYLQNITNENYGNKNTSRYERVLDVMKELKAAASRNNCPILALAQLNNPNRKTGANQEPNLYDLADASYVAQVATAVLVMYKVRLGEGDLQELRANIVKSRYGSQPESPFKVIRTAGSQFSFE